MIPIIFFSKNDTIKTSPELRSINTFYIVCLGYHQNDTKNIGRLLTFVFVENFKKYEKITFFDVILV